MIITEMCMLPENIYPLNIPWGKNKIINEHSKHARADTGWTAYANGNPETSAA